MQTVATEGGSWAPPWAASHFSILEDWLFLLEKTSRPWPRRGPRDAWGAEEGLVELEDQLAR